MKHEPTLLDLFSGIGGFSLAFEREGFRTIGFSEVDPYACSVLRKHWPNVHNYGDIRNVGRIYRPIDVIAGGFPCQDISTAGGMVGLDGKRSGMWFWMLETIRRNRPRFCVIENVPALRVGGIERVEAGLEDAGYKVRSFLLEAFHAGADHPRSRFIIIAYSKRLRRSPILHGHAHVSNKQAQEPIKTSYANSLPSRSERVSRLEQICGEPAILGSLDGVPGRVDRLRCLGNSVYPPVIQIFARFIYGCLRPGGLISDPE
jgi:DNA (cytosine-5)-methyltransferase 1